MDSLVSNDGRRGNDPDLSDPAVQAVDPELLEAGSTNDDPLLACLEYVAREAGKPVSRRATLNGLPLRNGRLTADLVPRAAERLGLKVQLVERSIADVPSLVVPFIVLFESGDACVVVRKQGRARRAKVVFPLLSEKPKPIRMAHLNRDASGYLFYVTVDDNVVERDLDRQDGAQRKGHWLWSSVLRFWPSWLQIVAAALVINMLGLAFPLFVMNVYDRVIPNLAIPTLVALAAGVALAVFFDLVLKQLRAVVLDQTGRRVDMRVAANLFEHALGVSMGAQTGSAGAVANQIREFETVRDFFTSSSIIAVTDLLFIGVFISILWLIAGPIALVPLLAVPLVLLVTLFIQIPLARSVRATQAQATRRHSILVESLIGVEAIKSVSGEGVMQRRWEDAVASTARANSSTKFWSSFAANFTATVQQTVGIVIIFWGVFLVSAGELTVGGLIAANILAGRVLAPLGSIAQTFARAQQSFVALRGLTAFMNLGEERQGAVVSGQQVERGEVEFRNVTFSYPGGNGETLKDVSLRITPGEKVGIIGRVGSGKTTIGKLMAGFYPTDKGTILVDGIDIRHYEPAELRASVGFVSQDPELFIGTLRENIILGRPNATDTEIAKAVEVSGVEAFSATHPLGLNMLIGERGRGLSGGQRQAVSLARMLLRRPKFLFLDEPSSSMDTNTELALIEHLREQLSEGDTLVACSHRNSFLELVDRLIVIEGGQIVADGPKEMVLDALRNQRFKADPQSADDNKSDDEAAS